jgi:branched-chain amino acid transport system ATP-binding protein
MDPTLQVEKLEKKFGGVVAVDGVDFEVNPHQIKAIIGPNGAGKTTIFNLICGIYPPTSGTVRFKQHKINGLKPCVIAKKGISRTFQNVQVFENMSVLENVMVGRHCRTRSELLAAIMNLKRTRAEEKRIHDYSLEMLSFVGLEAKKNEAASNLTFQQQKLLEFARALATEPDLILLDEPAAGLSVPEADEMAQLIYRIREIGITILLVEHDMGLVMEVSDEVIVLNSGQVIAEGTPREVQNDEAVIAVYLGEREKENADHTKS